MTFTTDVRRLLITRGLRAFGDGFVSLLLPLYLLALGFSPFQVGVIATVTLLGSGVLTLWVGLNAQRFRPRVMLSSAALLMMATGIGFASLNDFWPLLLIALAGTLNPSSGDASVFIPLEHAVLSGAVTDKQRTAAFARYSLTGSLCAALGSLAVGVPDVLVTSLHLEHKSAMQWMFIVYGMLGLITLFIYRGLTSKAEVDTRIASSPLASSKKRVYILAALFSLDSFGGGFVVQSMLALWLFERFQLSAATSGTIFFWSGLFSAFSYLVAVRIAKRIGLVNTMVFTHLPANLFLVLTPFMPSLPWATALLLARSALSQMDVPARSSYVMAIVPERERAAAASVTAVPRSLAAAGSPLLSGYLLGLSAFGWPLVLAGVSKIVYDLLLLLMFRSVRPPEELNHGRTDSA